jgi:protein-S-isoprenylcysteine O-methyltransferase Ste14
LDYYVNFLRADTQKVIVYLAIIYTIINLIEMVFYPKRKKENSKGLAVFEVITITLKNIRKIIKNPQIKKLQKINKKQKNLSLFILVKFFFLPLMLNFLFGNFYSILNGVGRISNVQSLTTLNSFNQLIFPLLISFIFFIDTLYFAFGYATEGKSLKNKLKSVEPTLFGWAVALICYPPLNSTFTNYISWFPQTNVIASTITRTFFLKIFIIFFLLIYLSATLALGSKSSNLTNRGIVSRGPYKIVRHPAYISKNISWWIMVIPIISIKVFASVLAWSVIYHLRAITEERHLMQDVDYREYCKKVKYRYIPFIY